jgi:hypothetical protein
MGTLSLAKPQGGTVDTELNLLFEELRVIDRFEERYAQVVREAIDYVIDKSKTGRTHLSQAEKSEKTHFGSKVESYLRIEFGWSKGDKLDFVLSNVEFDSKATTAENWMIPTEAVGEICLLTRIQESINVFHAGLLRANEENLNKGFNKDRKRSVSAAGRGSIQWLIYDMQIPSP